MESRDRTIGEYFSIEHQKPQERMLDQAFYDLSQRTQDIYTHPRRKDERKRSLMRQMFASLM